MAQIIGFFMPEKLLLRSLASLFVLLVVFQAAGDPASQEDIDRMIREYSATISSSPRQAEVYLKRGDACFLSREFDKAVDDFSAAIEVDDDFDMQRVILARNASYNPTSISGDTTAASTQTSSPAIDDSSNVTVPFGPTVASQAVPDTILPINTATEVSISQQPEAMFTGGSNASGIVATASVGGNPLSIQAPLVEIRQTGLAIKIIPPAGLWPHSSEIDLNITGTIELNGVSKDITIAAWQVNTVADTGGVNTIFYEDHQALTLTPQNSSGGAPDFFPSKTDLIVTRDEIRTAYNAPGFSTAVYGSDGVTPKTYRDIVQDPLGQQSRVLHAWRKGPLDSVGHAIKLNGRLGGASWPSITYDEVYFSFKFMVPANQTFSGGSKFTGLLYYDPVKYPAGQDVIGGNDAVSGFSARLMLHTSKALKGVGDATPEGPLSGVPTSYLYYYDHNYTPTKRRFGQIITGANPAVTTFPGNNPNQADPPNGATPVGILRGYWNEIEYRVKMNTMPGNVSGSAYELWVNGFKTISLIDEIMWRPANGSPGLEGIPADYGIRSFWIEIYHGGKNPTKYGTDTGNHYYFDEIHLSTSRIGKDRSSPLIVIP